MICKNCYNEFTNIDGLKFCAYCGWELPVELKDEHTIDTINNKENEIIVNEDIKVNAETKVNEDVKKKVHEDTQPMPAITKEIMKKYNRQKFFESLKKTIGKMKLDKTRFDKMKFGNKKVIIPIIVLLLVIAGSVFAYTHLNVKPVDEARIKQDLMGKIITLPKGTSIKINKNYIKNFSISARNTDKNKDDIKVVLTLNDGVIEAKTLLSLVYTYQGKNQWKISDKIVMGKTTSIKPVVGMNEKKFLEALKKMSISIGDTEVVLGGQYVKNLNISLRTPDLENSKEEISVKTSIDSGLLATAGTIKCKLVFENEVWSITNIEKDSNEAFALGLSQTFSDDTLIKAIRKQSLDELVSYPSFFGGKEYTINDNFTKNIKIAGKRYDVPKGVLYVNAQRDNIAGEIKSILTTGYTFSISLSKISLVDKSKSTVNSGTIDNITTPLIISTITNVEIEANNLFFWWTNNHKITAEEAKTFKADKILSDKGFQNIKYVYGSITYLVGEKKKNGTFVALYYLVYDGNKGYNWKLDKIIGADSPDYKALNKKLKK
jgi:hypothetical protein